MDAAAAEQAQAGTGRVHLHSAGPRRWPGYLGLVRSVRAPAALLLALRHLRLVVRDEHHAPREAQQRGVARDAGVVLQRGVGGAHQAADVGMHAVLHAQRHVREAAGDHALKE